MSFWHRFTARPSGPVPPRTVALDRPIVPALNSGCDLLVAVDGSGRMTRVNPVLTGLLGYEVERLVGQPIGLIVADEQIEKQIEAVLEAGSRMGVDQTYVTRSGARIPVLACGIAVRDRAGRPREVVWIARARSELHESAALRAARSSLQRVDAQRQKLEEELERARAARETEARERRRLEAELDRRAKDQLWAWAEEELRRVQGALQRTREKLHRVEEDLARALKDREWVEQRQRRSEEELQSLRDELQRQRRSGGDRTRSNALGRPLNGRPAPLGARVADGAHGSRPMTAAGGNAELERRRAPLRTIPDGLPETPVDWAEALAGVDGDVELLRTIATTFCEDGPQLLKELQAAIDDEELGRVERLARALKGAAANLGALAVAKAAQRVEAAFATGNIAETEEAYIALQLEVELLKPALKALRDRRSASVSDPAPRG